MERVFDVYFCQKRIIPPNLGLNIKHKKAFLIWSFLTLGKFHLKKLLFEQYRAVYDKGPTNGILVILLFPSIILAVVGVTWSSIYGSAVGIHIG